MRIMVESGMRFLYPSFIAVVEAIDDPKCTYAGENKNSRQGGLIFEIPDDYDVNAAVAKIKGSIKKDKKVGMTIFRVIPLN